MKKVRKGKKMILMLIALIIAIIIVSIIVVQVRKNSKKTEENSPEEQVVTLPETTYSGMDVSDIYMEYLRDNDETMITMTVTNTTSESVENEVFSTILIGGEDNVLGQMGYVTISDLAVGEQQSISVIYKGDLTATKQIKLEKMQESEQQ